jgi:type II secretory pathway component PulK
MASPRLPPDAGQAAILAIVFAAAIAMLAISMMRATTTESRITADEIAAGQIREALAGGVELAVAEIAAQEPEWNGALSLSGAVGPADVSVEITDEAAFLDINKSDPSSVAKLILGVISRASAPERSSQLADWGEDPPDGPGSALAYLRQRAQPFQRMTETNDVPGLDTGALRRLQDVVTVFSVDGRINPRLADDDVLSALPGVRREDIEAVRREHPDGTAITLAGVAAALPAAAPYLRQEIGPTYRIRAAATLRSFSGTLEAIIWVGADRYRPYRVLSWHENW